MIESGGLLVLAAAALALPPLAGRIHLPAVVLEILFGIVVGPVLGLVAADELTRALGELGFLLLLFLAGFEIDLRLFERSGVRPVLRAVALFGLTVGLAAAAAGALGLDVFMTLVLSTTSVGLVVPTLRSSGSVSSPLGQDILLAALVADFATLVIVSAAALAIRVGPDPRLLAFPVFVTVLVAVFAGLRSAAWWWPERFGRFFAARDPDALGVRFAIAVLLGTAGLAGVMGVEPALGAFLAGVGVSTVFRRRGELDHTLDGLAYGFLIPIFFIGVGLSFDLAGVGSAEALVSVAVLVAVSVVVKLVPSVLVLGRRHGVRGSAAAGLLLSARLSLIIVVARIGVELGVVPADMEARIILLAALSATLAPIGYRLVLPRPAAVEAGVGTSRMTEVAHV